jgi:hypothetical protein
MQSEERVTSEKIEDTQDSIDTWDFEKILQAAHYKGRVVYKVKYRDESGKTRTLWKYDGDLPEDVRKEFHIKYTFSGKARKRPQL